MASCYSHPVVLGSNLHPQTAPKKGNCEAPKNWKLDNLFEYAPKKPDGDHWELLLEPFLKRDNAQCEAWKDEVQNLLIFAGLFSAVVTAFIIESYKGLQRDRDDDIINLLSQIAIQLRSPLNTTSITPPLAESSLLPGFTPDSPTIRINTFWFISLVLSLTTVLIGIVSLQWLREHQNYTNLTPMQQYAILQMRNEGLERWHAHKIFAAMPLLLQSALVLFFTGMVDFLLAFGHISVVIPVSIVIGLTLLFLIATTLFPTLQGFALFFSFSSSGRQERPPAQCPYKSPQSNAFRAMCHPIFNLLRLLHLYIRPLTFDQRQKQTDEDRANRTFAQQIFCSERTWLAFDLNWLEIRDSFMRRAFRRPLDYFDRLGQDTKLNMHLPIWDILRGLKSQTHLTSLSPAYHAFSELFDKTFSPLDDHQNAYLYDVVAMNLNSPDVPFSDFYESGSQDLDSRSIMKYQALYTFLHRISSQDQESVSLHMAELQLRLISYLYASECPVRDDKQQSPLLFCLRPTPRLYNRIEQLQAVAQVTTVLFEAMSRESNPHALINVPCGRRDGLRQYIDIFGDILGAESTDTADQQEFCSVLDLANELLHQEMSAVFFPTRPGLLFYVAALFVHSSKRAVYNWNKPSPSSFKTLLSTLLRYKTLTIDKGLTDLVIEEQLASYDAWIDDSSFSTQWWSFLEYQVSSGSSESEDAPPVHGANTSYGRSELMVEEEGSPPPTELPFIISSHDRPYEVPDAGQTEVTSHIYPTSGVPLALPTSTSHANHLDVLLGGISTPGSLTSVQYRGPDLVFGA